MFKGLNISDEEKSIIKLTPVDHVEESESKREQFSRPLIRPTMEQQALINVNNCLNTNIYSYLETSGACTIKLLTAVIYGFP
jgi:hypothetical protein